VYLEKRLFNTAVQSWFAIRCDEAQDWKDSRAGNPNKEVCTQWLSQDQVKSRLAKEVRNITEGSQASSSAPYAYPFSAAESLADDFRGLGAAGDGSTYLDFLGILVTGKADSCSIQGSWYVAVAGRGQGPNDT